MQPTTSPTYLDLMPAYLGHLRRKNRSPRTIQLREYQVRRFFMATGLAPADVTIDDLRRYMDRDDWKPNTAAVVKASLSGIFGYAYDEELLPANPAKRLEAPKVPASKPRPASDEAVANALANATDRVRLMITLGALVGLRAMEISAVHSNDVTLTENGATLRVLGKGSKTRTIPISDDVAALLMSDEPRYMFPGRNGDGHISPAYVSRLVSKALPPGVTCHKLRHRFATRAYRNSGHNLRAVQLLLGHANISTTQIYTDVDNEELREAALSAA
jgi:integrase